MAACTVAFGVYAIMQNSFFFFYLAECFIRDKRTPAILKSSAPSTNTIELIPADMAYFKSTVAPTSTNRNISAATQSLLYFWESLCDNTLYFWLMIIPKLIMAKSPDNGMIPSSLFCSSINRKEKAKYN